MRYHVVAVGRMRDAALRAACNRYLERLRRYTKVEEREVKAEARILDAVAEGSCLVALAEQGDQWTSAQLADWTARWELGGRCAVASATSRASGRWARWCARGRWPPRATTPAFPRASRRSCLVLPWRSRC